jgi:hypothetical protein
MSGLVREDTQGAIKEKMFWDHKYGVGTKGSSKEIIILAASPSDKAAIRAILEEHGNVDSLIKLNTDSGPNDPSAVSSEWINERIDLAIRRISQYIVLASVPNVNPDIAKFVGDHLAPPGEVPARNLITTATVGTNQVKVSALSHTTGSNSKPFRPDSSPSNITKIQRKKLDENTYNAPFELAKRLRDLLYE